MVKLSAMIGIVSFLVSGSAFANNPILNIANALGEKATAEFNEFIDKQISDLSNPKVKPIHFSGIRYEGKCGIEKNTQLLVCGEIRGASDNNYEIVVANIQKAYANQMIHEAKSGQKKLPDGVTAEQMMSFIVEFAKKATGEKVNEIGRKHGLDFFESGTHVWIKESDIVPMAKHYSAVSKKDISPEIIIKLINCRIAEEKGVIHFSEDNAILINKEFFKGTQFNNSCTDGDATIQSRMTDFLYKFGDDVDDFIDGR